MELADPFGGCARFCVDLSAELPFGNGGWDSPRTEPFGCRAPVENTTGHSAGYFGERANGTPLDTKVNWRLTGAVVEA